MTDKQLFRKQMLALDAGRKDQNKQDLKTGSIIDKISSILLHEQVTTIGTYVAFRHEPDISPTILLFQEKQFALPKILKKNFVIASDSNDSSVDEMSFCKYKSRDELEITESGFSQPTNSILAIPDIVFAPGVAFDLMGYRMGYGKGFYDKYFDQNERKIIKVGICFHNRLVNTMPREKHDIKMNYVITEKLILKIC